MRRLTRRAALSGIGAAAGVVTLAGCTGGQTDGGADTGTDADTDADTNTTGTDTDTNTTASSTDDTDEPTAAADEREATHQVHDALSGAAWQNGNRPGFCTLFTERSAAAWLLTAADAETVAFVDDTDFDETALLYAESIGSTTCYRAVTFGDVTVEGDTLLASAQARDTSDANTLCGEAITYPAAFRRVAVDTPPSSFQVTLTDGFGTTATLTDADGIRDPATLAGGVKPSGDPPAVPPDRTCDDAGFERLGGGYTSPVNWGDGGGTTAGAGLALRVLSSSTSEQSPLTFERGETVTIRLTNVSARPIGVGNRRKYSFEVHTETGWSEVRGSDDGPIGYTDELITIPPGERFEWSFVLTEAGIVDDTQLRVCPSLRPGRYRFVFFGADDLAVAFDYVGTGMGTGTGTGTDTDTGTK